MPNRGSSFLLAALVLVAAASVPAAPAGEELPTPSGSAYRSPVTRQSADGAAAVFELFAKRGYTLSAVADAKSAPRVFVQSVPHDLAGLPTHQKVETFIALMLTNVLKVNEDILATRETLLELDERKKAGRELSPDELGWLAGLATTYDAPAGDLEELARRVDAIPPSLAIAQSIDESGWGTSHFAREGNALFGEHLPSHSNGKFVETPGGHVKVAAFDTVREGVAGYIHNLNTTRAYADLRRVRADARTRSAIPSGHDVAAGLASYSARGMAYVDTLRELMKEHGLTAFDVVDLTTEGGALLIEVGR